MKNIRVGLADFGEGIDIDSFLERVLRDVIQLDSIDAKIALQDLYETEFGIFNHVMHSASRPLSSVAFHEAEEINDNSLLERAIRTYVVKRIGDIFKISLTEFLDLPKDVIEMLLGIATEEERKKQTIMDETEKAMKSM